MNDIVCKGVVKTINMINMLLRFSVGRFAFSGDIKQFYNCCKLTPQQWNLQRFLWQAGLDPNAPLTEGVITTLIYGVKSVSAQSEHSLELLAEIVEEFDAELAEFIRDSRYCDDLGDSKEHENLVLH